MTRELFEKNTDPVVRRHNHDEAERKCLRILSDIADQHGLDVCAAAAGIAGPNLRQALDAKPGRHLGQRQRVAILDLGSDEQRTAYANLMLRAWSKKTAPLRERTVEERLRDLEFAVAARFGEAGVELVEQERSRP